MEHPRPADAHLPLPTLPGSPAGGLRHPGDERDAFPSYAPEETTLVDLIALAGLVALAVLA
jgi:hypothetical protein